MSPQKRLQRFLSRHGSNENPATESKERIRSVGSADLDHPSKDQRNLVKPLVKSHSHFSVAKTESATGNYIDCDVAFKA